MDGSLSNHGKSNANGLRCSLPPQGDVMEKSAATRILLLGPTAVDVGGATKPVASRQQALFLALLAVAPGRPLTTDDFLDRGWPGVPPPTARAAVRVQLARLRTLLRSGPTDLLPHTPQGYALDPRVVSTDVVDLDRLVLALATADAPDSRLSLAEEGLALWRGEPTLASFDDAGLRIEAQRVMEVRLDLEEVRADALLALGQHARLCGELVSLVAAAPLRERRTRQLMLALYRAGRQADALAAFRALRDRLADELGLDPSHATAALELAILRQEAWLSGVDPPDAPPGEDAAALPVTEPLRGTTRPNDQLITLVDLRLSLLAPEARRLLLLAALLDQHAGIPVLADAVDATVAEAERLAAQVVAAGLARRATSGGLRLRPEFRDAVASRADATELAHASHRAGVALARHRGTPAGAVRAAWLVVRGDGPWEEVEPVLHQALGDPRAHAARRVHGALRASAALCGAAAEVAPDAATRADFLIRRAQGLALTGNAQESTASWREAIAAARESEDAERIALALLAQDWAHRTIDTPAGDVIAHLREALHALGPRPSALRQRLVASLAQEMIVLAEERPAVPDLLARAARDGVEVDDPESLAITLATEHVMLRGSPDLARRRALADELEAAASRTQNPEWRLPHLWGARLFDAYAAGDLHAVPALADLLLGGAEALGSQRLEWQHAVALASLHRDRGEFDRADDWADHGGVLGDSAGVPDAATGASAHRILASYLTGSTAPFAPMLSAFVAQRPESIPARSLLALTLAQAGDTAAAGDALDIALAMSPGDPPAQSAPLNAGVLTDVARLLKRTDVVDDLTERLEPFAGQWLVFGPAASTWGPADRCLGLLAALAGNAHEAARLLDRARMLAATAEAAAWVSRCDADLAWAGMPALEGTC